MAECVRVGREGRLTILTIDRPEARNALDAVGQREMAMAFDDFFADDEQWVAIVTGAGDRAFCAGHDLKQQAAGGGMETPPTGFAGLTHRFDAAKPVIAAVNGAAFGGGFELALACDLVVAAPNAVFGLSEPRVGLAALGGGIQRLPHIVGLTRAMGMLLTGRRVDAAEALAMGMVNEVAEDGALAGARRWAGEILACSPMSVRGTKRAVLDALAQPFAVSIPGVWDQPGIQAMLASDDATEGPRAFVARRAPRWLGR